MDRSLINRTFINGTGVCIPDHFLDRNTVANSKLEKELDMAEGSIELKTGIRQRAWSSLPENNYKLYTIEEMAANAAVEAVKSSKDSLYSGTRISRVSRIIISRDIILTRRARSVGKAIIEKLYENKISVDKCYSIDLTNYCPGFVHALHIAELMVRNDEADHVLVVSSTDYTDIINTNHAFNKQFEKKFDLNAKSVLQYSLSEHECFQPPKDNAFLWGCGAGAVVVSRVGPCDYAFTGSEDKIIGYGAWGAGREKHVPSNTEKGVFDQYLDRTFMKHSFGIGESDDGKAFASLDGLKIYKYAMTEVPKFIEHMLSKYKIDPKTVKLVPHQPNPRILNDLSQRIPIPKENTIMSCHRLGNMIGASIPVTYHFAKESTKRQYSRPPYGIEGTIKKGDVVFFCSFGDSYLTTSGLLFKAT